jgi:hypothetical protein
VLSQGLVFIDVLKGISNFMIADEILDKLLFSVKPAFDLLSLEVEYLDLINRDVYG